MGEVSVEVWGKSASLRQSDELDEHVVRLNHLHGIRIYKQFVEMPRQGVL
jgi:hypothetical protein